MWVGERVVWERDRVPAPGWKLLEIWGIEPGDGGVWGEGPQKVIIPWTPAISSMRTRVFPLICSDKINYFCIWKLKQWLSSAVKAVVWSWFLEKMHKIVCQFRLNGRLVSCKPGNNYSHLIWFIWTNLKHSQDSLLCLKLASIFLFKSLHSAAIKLDANSLCKF